MQEVPLPLLDLLTQNSVSPEEVQDVVALKGYYPRGTPIANYAPDFINGVLVGAWPQVFKMIQDTRNRTAPF